MIQRAIKAILFSVLLSVPLCAISSPAEKESQVLAAKGTAMETLPTWNGKASVILNDNVPGFSDVQKLTTKAYVKYSDLDALGRPGVAMGCLGEETVNEEERAPTSSIKPAGWQTKKYEDLITDRYVYNRCHLLMQAAAAGIQTEKCNGYENLITGTRYLNVDGMLPYETRLLSYLRDTKNHVIYRGAFAAASCIFFAVILRYLEAL